MTEYQKCCFIRFFFS